MICNGCELKRIERKEKAFKAVWERHIYIHQVQQLPTVPATAARVFQGDFGPGREPLR
jgi:hypothetical protein